MDGHYVGQTLTKNATMHLINETLLSEESFSRRIFRSALIFEEFYTPLMCLFGTLGNSLSLAVFSTNPKFKNQSASLYLSALAISDTGYLLSLLAVWLEGVLDGGGIITLSNFSCSLFMYLGQVTCFLSVYLTVAFTIERFVAVHSPFKKGRVFTRTKAKRCVAALSIIALLICSYAWVIAKLIKYPMASAIHPTAITTKSDEIENSTVVMTMAKMGQNSSPDGQEATWNEFNEDGESSFSNIEYHHQESPLGITSTRGPPTHDYITTDNSADAGYTTDESESDYICSVPEAFYEISEIANYCDTVITLIIPFLLIAFFNVQIATCIWRLKKQRKSILATTSPNSKMKRTSNLHSKTVNVTQEKVLFTPARDNGPRQTVLVNSLHNVSGERGPRHNVILGATVVVDSQEQQRQRCSNYNCTEIRITKTLLLVSSAFLVLNLPSHLIRCGLFIQNVTGTKEGHEMLRAFQPWANILFNTNFAVNFLLYCVSGKSFRSSLRHLLLRMIWGREDPHLYQHRRGNAIRERMNRSFQPQHRYPPVKSTTEKNFPRVGLVHGNRTVDTSILFENSKDGLVKDTCTHATEIINGGAAAMGHISSV